MDQYWAYSAEENEADIALLKEFSGCAIQILDDTDCQVDIKVPIQIPTYNFESKMFVRVNNLPKYCDDCGNEFVNFKNYRYDKDAEKSVCNICYNNRY
jgi:hypothetical protein